MAKIKEPNHKEFKAEYLKDFKEEVFEPEKVAWLNSITINSNISIE